MAAITIRPRISPMVAVREIWRELRFIALAEPVEAIRYLVPVHAVLARIDLELDEVERAQALLGRIHECAEGGVAAGTARGELDGIDGRPVIEHDAASVLRLKLGRREFGK